MDESTLKLVDELVDVTRQMRSLHPGTVNARVEGMTAAEVSALMGIDIAKKQDIEPRPGIIAERLHITKSALSQTLKLLEEKGLIDRARLKRDSRGVVLTLTKKGQALVDGLIKDREEYFENMIEFVGEKDLRAAVRIANKVVKYQESIGYVRSGDGAVF